MSCHTFTYSKDIITTCRDISITIDPVWDFILFDVLQGLYQFQAYQSLRQVSSRTINALIPNIKNQQSKQPSRISVLIKNCTWSWPNSFFLNLHIFYHNKETTETILSCFIAQTLSIILGRSLEPIKIMVNSFFWFCCWESLSLADLTPPSAVTIDQADCLYSCTVGLAGWILLYSQLKFNQSL